MDQDLQEQACWLLLAFESELTTRIVNGIIIDWCYQFKRTLQDFFDADVQAWVETCHLNNEIVAKLKKAKEKRIGQVFLAEQLAHNHIQMLTVLDSKYPKLLKLALKRSQLPPVLFYAGDLQILDRDTIAIIGSRNADQDSLAFTYEVAQYLATHGANVISGNARGVDRTAYEAVLQTSGCTTVVLPQGIRKLSGVQMRSLVPRIEDGSVLLLSQFQPDAAWLVSRAMERNQVVTGLAQIVIVAESGTDGGTWEGANGALKQKRPLFIRQSITGSTLPGNEALISLGGHPLSWPADNIAEILTPILQQSDLLHQQQSEKQLPPQQLSLLKE